jgi:biopolymer transport protein ExbD
MMPDKNFCQWRGVELISYCVLLKTILMAEINTAVNDRRRRGVRRMKKHSLRTDMTPMVDLGFLLITFFVFTTELSKPVITKLNMPKEGGEPQLGESNALTVLAGKDNSFFYYQGDWEKALKNGAIKKTNLSFNGLGDIIRAKQTQLDKNLVNNEGRNGLMLLIKPGPEASYSNVINMLDEALINDIKKYAIVKLTDEEARWLNQFESGHR